MSQEPLRILITNWILDEPGGTALYVRELATALLERGHRPVVYSQIHGRIAHEMGLAAIPVVNHLDRIGSPPHIIHGHHHIETMSAVLRFGGTPAVFVCHGILPMQEAPPRSPRVLRYLAVSKATRDRLVLGHGIPEEKVEISTSFVDLSRFRPRDALPPRPHRALAFGNHLSERNGLPEIREACARAGLLLDAVGAGVGRIEEHPERLLLDYDIVFAKGRCALEAAAVGCAVIACSDEGVGRPVRPDSVHDLHLRNFGTGALTETLSAGLLLERIAQYDPSEAAEVSQRIREAADIRTIVARFERVYRDVLTEWEAVSPTDPQEEMKAASDYLQQWGTTFYARDLTAHYEREIKVREQEIRRLKDDAVQCREDVERSQGTESEAAALRRELDAVYRSASWRWVQWFLRLPVIRTLLGPVIRRVARTSGTSHYG